VKWRYEVKQNETTKLKKKALFLKKDRGRGAQAPLWGKGKNFLSLHQSSYEAFLVASISSHKQN
jgi:hypothetical protein